MPRHVYMACCLDGSCIYNFGSIMFGDVRRAMKHLRNTFKCVFPSNSLAHLKSGEIAYLDLQGITPDKRRIIIRLSRHEVM
jgi:hypothetical protein